MTVFQYIAMGALGLLIVFSLWSMFRGKARPLIAIGWILVWITALLAILFPETVTSLARYLGIKRGADLVLYGAVLAGLLGFFFLFTRLRATRRQITLLTRKIAIYDAELKKSQERGVEEGSGDLSTEDDR